MPNCVAFRNLHVCQKTIARRREGDGKGEGEEVET